MVHPDADPKEETMETARVIQLDDAMRGITPEHCTRFLSQLDEMPKTISVYARALKLFRDYLGDNTTPQRVDIQAYKISLMGRMKPNSVNLYLTAVRVFFRWMEIEGLYADICRGIDNVKVSKNFKKDPLTPAQVREVLASIDNTRDRAILMLMATAGLRCIEVVRANIEDLRTLGSDVVLFVWGKGRLDREEYVKVKDRTFKAILSHLEERGDPLGSEPLFTSNANQNKGGRLTPISVSRMVKTAMRKAGLNSPRLTAHSLRHTCATTNLIQGGTIQETQQMLRHSNIQITMGYLHNLERVNNNSEGRVEDALFGDLR